MAWIRDGIPVWVVKNLYPGLQLVISIHGSNFLSWSPGGWKAAQFARLLRMADAVTVLGPRQKLKLQSMGISESRVQVLDNCCEFKPIPACEVDLKHGNPHRSNLNLLYLSNLIDTKGYPVFLEGLDQLSKRTSRHINAVLCGQLTGSQFSKKFKSMESARCWIEEMVSTINLSSTVNLEWVEGAWGDEKKALFQEADIFVFPSTYKVEAQPIVLLEAMAHGCAIIASKVGEICSMLSDSEAILLDQVDQDSVVTAMIDMIQNDEKRIILGKNGWKRYTDNYTSEYYLARWESLLAKVNRTGEVSNPA